MAAKNKVKITVIKKMSTEDVYGNDFPYQLTDDFAHACHLHNVGDEFIVPEDGSCPTGFCGWAFAGIHSDISHLRWGGKFPHIKDEKGMMQICCCTDGLRPVFFKLEIID